MLHIENTVANTMNAPYTIRVRTVMENLESREFMISISRPGKSWNSSEGHGKAICFQKIKRQKHTKFEK